MAVNKVIPRVPCPCHNMRADDCNKSKTLFDRNVSFVSKDTQALGLPSAVPINMNDPEAYLRVASAVRASRVPSYKGLWVPLPSAFNWEFRQINIQGYRDELLLDYLRFGFPLGIKEGQEIHSNAVDNHSSAKAVC